MKNMKLLIGALLFLVPVLVPAQEEAVRVGEIRVEYKDKQKTREDALINYMDIKEGQEYDSQEALDDALAEQLQDLKNTRYFQSVEILPMPTEEDPQVVGLTVVIQEGWTFVPIPYPIPDTSIGKAGWSFGTEINYDNAFGSMKNFYFDGYMNFAFGEETMLKKWRLNPKLKDVKVGDLSFTFEFYQEYSTTKNLNDDGTDILDYYTKNSSFLKASTDWDFYGDWTYSFEPEIGMNYGYKFYEDFEGDPVSNNNQVYMDKLNFIWNHSIGPSRVDWVGPLRDGYGLNLSNNLKVLQSQINDGTDAEFRFVADLELEGIYYLPLWNRLNYFTRGTGLIVFGDEYDGLGDRLRGVKNETMAGDMGLFWQNTLAIQIFNVKSFNFQMHPFIDLGLTHTRGEDFDFGDELRFGFGSDVVFMLGSVDITVKAGYDVRSDYFDFTFFTGMSY